jgi:hypothetical protein
MPRNYIASSQIFAAIICSNTTTVFPLQLLKRLQTSVKNKFINMGLVNRQYGVKNDI